MTLTIVSLLPRLQNTNGDAENAAVLATRARWAGLEAVVVPVERRTELPARVDAIVLGSGDDSSLEAARAGLAEFHDDLRAWGTEGIPILAVGTGWELLSWGIERHAGGVIEGLGILPGRAVPRDGRVTGDIVLSSPRFGALVGFENHARDYVGAEGSPLGRTRVGIGNGRDSRQEGVVMGNVIGTHLHGPVLARNPQLADRMLQAACDARALSLVPSAQTASVDGMAKAARNQVAVRLSLTSE